jgi:uncharacterized metal-binding protein YceD (DUF177 family)
MKSSYELIFGNLKLENHEFDYRLGKEFFDTFDSEESKDGEVDVHIHLEKAASHLDMNFTVKGWVLCSCDVCLSEIKMPIDGQYYLHVKLVDTLQPDEAELMYIDRGAFKLDLTQLLYEYTFLSLPYRKLCEESLNKDRCDESFTKRLNNEETENETDPQWDKLKDLFKK